MAHGYPSKSKIRSYFIKSFMMNKTTFHTGAKGTATTLRSLSEALAITFCLLDNTTHILGFTTFAEACLDLIWL